jgi:hypothetical protein
VRFASALFLISWVAFAGSTPQPASERDGESLFRAFQLNAAEREFEETPPALQNSASLHFWTGRLYARLPEVASPSAAHKNAGKAPRAWIAPQSYWVPSASITAARQHDHARHEFTGAGSGIKGGVRRLGALIGRLLP